MLTCTACGQDNTADVKFCESCGTPLAAACPHCGAARRNVQARFCGECGGALATEATAPAPAANRRPGPAAPPPVAERRVCSVLFADLVGFTPFTEARDPEEVREVLSRYFEVARTIIDRYGGTVEKFIGDAVMAVWGTPVAAEGDAERAVRAALDVVDAVAALGVEVGAGGIAARAGVVTGEVAVNLGATGEGMVAGDAVNTAARVQSAAPPGGVLVDTTTRRLASASVGFTDAGEHSLKGKAEPEQLWHATRVLAGVGGSQRVDGLEAPLIGRDAELRTIKELLHAAIDRRTPRMVVVNGAAGVGKSRIGWEFEKYVDGLKRFVAWHRGRCLSYGDGVAFWALAEAVRQRLRIAEEDPNDVAARKLAEGLARIVPDPAEREYVAVRIGRLLGVPVEGDAGGQLGREELFAGWRTMFERLAAQDPVVWVVEDAQYADAGLLDFLDHLIDWVRDVPIYIVVLARSDLEQRRPGFGLGRNRTVLTLDPLDAVSMDRLVDSLVPGMPPDARAAITRHAQGVPLFAVETIRSLVDRDIVVPVEGVYRLVGDVGALSVPDSLHGLLAARLDTLGPSVRALVADAAVLGSTFPAEALIAVSEQDEAAVRAGLSLLLQREVLEVSADRLSPQRGSYRFAQELLRQVAYETLSRRDRKTRHLAVAAHLRRAFPDDGEEAADVIAQHYLDALSAVPGDADADEIRAEALTMWARAGDRAVRAGAPAAAAANFATAAECAAPLDPVRAAGLWESAADVASQAAEQGRAYEYAERAREMYLTVGDARAAARATALAGRALRRLGRHTDAQPMLLAALEVLNHDPDTDTVIAMSELAALETFAGRPDAERLTAEVLALAQALDVDRSVLAQCLVTSGIMHTIASRTIQAAASFLYSARLAERAGDTATQGRALLNLADAMAGFDWPAAEDAARSAIELLRRVGARWQLSVATANLVEVMMSTGRWDEADAVLYHAVEADGLGDQELIAAYRSLLAGHRGDADLPDDPAADLPNFAASEDPSERATLAQVQMAVALGRGDQQGVLRFAQQALSHVEEVGIRSDMLRWAWPAAVRAADDLGETRTVAELLALADSHPVGHVAPVVRAERDLARARLLGQEGGDAGPLFERAIAGHRRIPSPYHLAHALLDHAEWLAASGQASAAATAVAEAGEIAHRLSARPLAARVDVVAKALEAQGVAAVAVDLTAG